MPIRINNNGGNNFFCDKHMKKEFMPLAIFIAALVHDDLLFDNRFQKMVIESQDLEGSALKAMPWCCFIGDKKMNHIYQQVYEQTKDIYT